TIALAPVFDIHAEDCFDRLVASGESVVAHAGETDLVGGSMTRLGPAGAVARVAKGAHNSQVLRIGIAGQTRAEQAVELALVAITGGVESPHQTVALQVAVMLPLAADAGVVRSERCGHRERCAHLSAMAGV